MLDEEYIKKQNEAYGYYDEPVVADGIVTVSYKTIDGNDRSLEKKIYFNVGPSNIKTCLVKQMTLSKLATTINDFAFYAKSMHTIKQMSKESCLIVLLMTQSHDSVYNKKKIDHGENKYKQQKPIFL